MRNLIVRNNKQTSTRNKNRIYLRVTFKDPVMCKLDNYIKERCMHERMSSEGSICHACMQENPSCDISHASWCGGLIKFTPSPKMSVKRQEKESQHRQKIRTRERIKRIRENGGKI